MVISLDGPDVKDGVDSEKLQYICAGSGWRYGLVLMYADAGKNEDWRLQDESHTKWGVNLLWDIGSSNCNSCRFSSLLGRYAVSTSRNIPEDLGLQQHPCENLRSSYWKKLFLFRTRENRVS
jgi:hypothetical protein